MDGVGYLSINTINGLNLWSYCGNNPVMRKDSNGTNWFTDWWDDIWNSVGDWFNNIGNSIGNWFSGAWNSVSNWFSNNWQDFLMGYTSVLLTVGGIVLLFVPGGQAAGVFLISAGLSSLIGGLMNQSKGGSFFAGWLGGFVGGAIGEFSAFAPGLTAVFGAIGGFLGSAITDAIDNGWDNINWGNAGISAAFGAFMIIIPLYVYDAGVEGIGVEIWSAIRSIFTEWFGNSLT